MSKIFDWTVRYLIPYGASTIMAYFAADWFDSSEGSFSSTVGVLVLENGAFYPIFWACDKLFFSEEEKVLSTGKELIKQLILIDALDNILRLFLFFLVPKLFPDNTELATAIVSAILDIGFALALHRSRRLLEIVNELFHESSEHRLGHWVRQIKRHIAFGRS